MEKMLYMTECEERIPWTWINPSKHKNTLPPQAYKKQITNIEEGTNIERKKTKLKTPTTIGSTKPSQGTWWA